MHLDFTLVVAARKKTETTVAMGMSGPAYRISALSFLQRRKMRFLLVLLHRPSSFLSLEPSMAKAIIFGGVARKLINGGRKGN